MGFTFVPAAYPASPGVYLMKNARGTILYVGKAKSLRARLASYFRDDPGQTPKTRALVARIAAVDVLLTASEKEALLLEAGLIKKHKPRYNVVLRDDKQYILFKLDKRQEYPRLRFTRKVERDGAAYFGPFASASAARSTWKELNRLFPLRKCSDHALRNRSRPCLYHHLGQCLAPCVTAVPRQEYLAAVRRVEDFLNGRSAEVLRGVEREMLAASEALEFERAARLRDLLAAMRKTVEGQAAVLPGFADLDALQAVAGPEGLGLCLLFVRQGRLLDAKSFVFKEVSRRESAEAARAVLTQFYRPERFIPARILLSREMVEALADPSPATDSRVEEAPQAGDVEEGGGLEALAELLAERRGGPVRLAAPRGEYEERLLELAGRNAARALVECGKGRAGQAPPLAGALRLAAEPRRIETVDISHLGGTGTRAGVTVFEEGAPKKEDYRVYNLPELEGTSDDYLALAVWAKRRLASGPPWPDLLLIDGGKGQLAAVARALEEAGGAGLFALAAIAKVGRGKAVTGDQVFRPGRKNPLNLAPGGPELLFLQRLRDGVHDFVIGRQRRGRKKTALRSALDALPGVGPATAKILWERFESLAAMAAARPEELAALPGFGPKKAARVLAALKSLGAEAARSTESPAPS